MYSTRDASMDLSTQPPKATIKLQLPDAWMFYKNGLFVAIIDAEHTVTNPSGPRPGVTEQLKLECTMHSDIFIVTPSQLLQRKGGVSTRQQQQLGQLGQLRQQKKNEQLRQQKKRGVPDMTRTQDLIRRYWCSWC